MIKYLKNNILEINRGDTANVSIWARSPEAFLTDNGSGLFLNRPFDFVEGDILLFHIIEPHDDFYNPIIAGKFIVHNESTPNIQIRLDHEDTMKLLPKLTYYYEVKLIRADDSEHPEKSRDNWETVIPRTKFIVLD